MPCGSGPSRTVSDVEWFWRKRIVHVSGSARTALCKTRLWRAVSKEPRWRRQHVRQTRTWRDECCKAGWCKQRGRQQVGEMEAESSRDRMWQSPRLACIYWWDLWKIWKFSNFSKNLKMLVNVWKAHKTKIFWKFWKNFVYEIFQISLVLCALRTISCIFQFFENFENIQKFQNPITWCVAEAVLLGLFLM
jgi:hypothetical protein